MVLIDLKNLNNVKLANSAAEQGVTSVIEASYSSRMAVWTVESSVNRFQRARVSVSVFCACVCVYVHGL